MKNITLKILAASFINIVTAIVSVAQSTSGKIEGSVINEQGEPVEYVNVLLRQPKDSALITGAITNAVGQYTFESIANGNYIITLAFVGYQKQSMSIQFQNGTSNYTLPPIVLKQDTKLLGEVVVRAQKPLIEHQDGKLILNVQNSIVATGGSASELLERTPGVSIDQNNQISLNGKVGVTVMIDGKITYLPPAELLTLLRSMSANNVATIEVITNPSSRYDAAGSSGMINIKTKRNTLEGFNGSATAGVGYGHYGKINGNINLSYNTKKWSHFLNYGYIFNKRFYDAETQRASLFNGDSVYFMQELHRIQKLPSHTWQAGSEWRWNSRNSISLSTSGNYNERFTDNDQSTQVKSSLASETDSTFNTTNNQSYRWYNISASLGYKHIFAREGSELTVDGNYSDYDFRLSDNFIIKQFEKESIFKNEYNVVSDQPSSFKIYTGRTDYTHRLSKKISFETGIKYSHVNTVNNILFKNNLSGQFETDSVRSNDFNYTEQIGAAYVNVKTKLLGFDAQLGLRTEQTQYKGFSVTSNKSIERKYTNFFPSINMNRDLSENYRLGLSYSYRIDRPTYSDLYPYVFFFDPFDSQLGNPTLLPQYTHNIQVSQTIAKDYVINLGYSSISQYINFTIQLDEDQKSIYSTKKNFDTFQSYYLNVVAPIRVTRNWTINGAVNLFYNKFNTQLLSGVYSINRFSGIANISQTITLPHGISFELTGVYNAPNISGLLQVQSYGTLNAGIQKVLLDKKASLRLSISDILQTNRVRNLVQYPGFDMDMHIRWETRIVRLNFTYTIGKVSKRKNAMEDEQKRMGVN